MLRFRHLTPLWLLFVVAFGVTLVAPAADAQPTFLPDLDRNALIVSDSFGIPHICAASERDATLLLGWVHARDRMFQMDQLRRTFSGTLAELVGAAGLASDVQFRTLGLDRAATASLAALDSLAADEGSASTAVLAAYADGVNAYLADHPLPDEYAALELTGVDPWTALDSLIVAKGLAFGLSFDLADLDRTIALQSYVAAGNGFGFDGTALFSEDIFRTAPFDDRVTVPGNALQAAPAANQAGGKGAARALSPRALELARRYRDSAAAVPELAKALERSDAAQGSNWWLVGGDHTTTGHAFLANDPHLSLDTPAVFYEAHLMVSATPRCGLPEGLASLRFTAPERSARGDVPPSGDELNVNGVSFAGMPAIVQGCNSQACWGASTNPMDVTDIYLEELVVDAQSGLPVATVFQGDAEPIVTLPQSFRSNVIGDQVDDNLEVVDIPPLAGGTVFLVPRRNRGPIIDLETASEPPIALSVQYTGWGATYEIEAYRRMMRAASPDDFAAALDYFDVGSQNWAYADVAGNIAYFSSAEMPLREDLQSLGAADGGVPPFFIRDGTGTLAHEWIPSPGDHPATHAIPFATLPSGEMPQSVNPAGGYLANANNDPIGLTLDNDALNQTRPGGGIYYLGRDFDPGLRMGRIDRVIESLLDGGQQATPAQLTALQADNRLLDAEIVVPFLLAAYDAADDPMAPVALQALGADPEITEAISRLSGWNLTTPTGIDGGWDPGDDPAGPGAASVSEVSHSVAATIWSVWRGQAVRRIIDDPLTGLGLQSFLPGSTQAYVALANLLEDFDAGQGIGASGVDFFPQAPSASRAHARDLALLGALRDALDLLAGPEFDSAFGGSGDQDDYRWGLLHRVRLDHLLGGPFSIPPAAGFEDVAPALPGLARAGGFHTVDAASHSARADSVNEFMFGSGPARRFAGILDPAGIGAQQVIPGGESGDLDSEHFGDQLPLWLTNRYHALRLTPEDVAADAEGGDEFTPTEPCQDGPTTLCLLNDRFQVEVRWRKASGQSGQGMVVPFSSEKSGNFYFFNADNWEVLIKMLDGCAVNDHFWVFAAATTNVEYTITVTDTQSGISKPYGNPLGMPSAGTFDTAAFATCR